MLPEVNALAAKIEELEQELEKKREELCKLQNECVHDFPADDGEVSGGKCELCGYDPMSRESEDLYFGKPDSSIWLFYCDCG